MPEGEIYDAIDRFRRNLLHHERQAASELVRVYGETWKRIKAELERLHTEYEAAKLRGEKIDADWIYQFNRARSFRDQVLRELLDFSRYAESKIRAEQSEAIQLAEEQAERLVRLALGKPPEGLVIDWDRIDHAAVQTILGMTQADSPLHRLLLSIANGGAQVAEDALIQGMLLGKNPREVARELRRALGITLSRALRIARTETLRAHREATRASYQTNSDIVEGWIWHSAADERTCAACWAMHGTEHRLSEILDDHPNGRCAMIPRTKTWAEIGKQFGLDLSGIEDTQPKIPLGTGVFVGLPAKQQIKILGPAKYAAWKDGQFTLSDLVGRARSKEWGTHRYEKSLAELGINARKYLIPPKRSVFGKTRSEVEKIAKEIDAKIGEIVGGMQKWSGRIFIKSKSTLPDAWGVKEWNCDIWLRDDSDVHTLIHELLHGRSIGLTPEAYNKYRPFEEATVEGLARNIGSLVYLNYSGHHGSYQEFIDIFENIRARTEFSGLDFYLMLLKTDLSSRINFLLDLFSGEDYYDVVDILSALNRK